MKRRTYIFLIFLCAFSLAGTQKVSGQHFVSFVESELNTRTLLYQPKALLHRVKNNPLLNISSNTVLYSTLLGMAVLLFLTVAMLIRHQRMRLANEHLKAKNKEIEQKNKILKELHQRSKVQHTKIANQQQELEEMNLVKDKMFSIIAHDFRSPLNTIQGVLNLLYLDVLSPEELKSMLPQLSRKVNNSISLLDNLLNWARTQMNGLKINKINFTLRPEVEETVGLVSQIASQKSIRIENNIERGSQVHADPDMIQLVVRNLLWNAIKFTNSGGIVRISAQHKENVTIVAVSDTGVGMAESSVQQLFQRAGYSTKGTDQEKGTGLGLVLCNEFVRRNGGKIWVESKKDEGTTFYFTLPIVPLLETSTLR
ncbi:sensor histidine kinase [Tunicatimonas pelagia]|uniref:sensor histidine kinase n=1 Tax=Tunicatimonas pelagia TaxID=931531 RepID=UPI002666BB30|nr:HAMP domain-containing sensor histidine kinase [Tunicatimonas pelagia]WKN42412.1 HAMP domain-containing sensor histidine kinase [Tunicatimonas pelagia]